MEYNLYDHYCITSGVPKFTLSKQTKTNSVAVSQQANFTDRAITAIGEINADFCR
jgi:hypothetical protein